MGVLGKTTRNTYIAKELPRAFVKMGNRQKISQSEKPKLVTHTETEQIVEDEKRGERTINVGVGRRPRPSVTTPSKSNAKTGGPPVMGTPGAGSMNALRESGKGVCHGTTSVGRGPLTPALGLGASIHGANNSKPQFGILLGYWGLLDPCSTHTQSPGPGGDN